MNVKYVFTIMKKMFDVPISNFIHIFHATSQIALVKNRITRLNNCITQVDIKANFAKHSSRMSTHANTETSVHLLILKTKSRSS